MSDRGRLLAALSFGTLVALAVAFAWVPGAGPAAPAPLQTVGGPLSTLGAHLLAPLFDAHPWTQTAINAPGENGADVMPLLPPLAAWVAASGGLWWGLTRQRPLQGRLAVLLALVLAAWALLDLGFHGRLTANAIAVAGRAAGAEPERHRRDFDGGLYRELEAVRERLPAHPATIVLVVGTDPLAGLLAKRCRYHLAPHNVLIADTPGELSGAVAALSGSYFLLELGEAAWAGEAEGGARARVGRLRDAPLVRTANLRLGRVE